MSLNDIVVYVDSAEATKSRVEFAVALAKDHGAHLRGRRLRTDVRCYRSTAPMSASPI